MLKMLFAAVLILGAMACSHSAAPGKGQTPAESRGATPVGDLVTFQRVGGFAGFNDTLVVARDGSLTLTDKTGAVKKGAARAADLKDLDSLLHSAEFKAAAKSYESPGGADRITYTIGVAGGPTVTAMDGVAQPEPVSKAVQMLSEMIGEVR